jgi:hypothetical protein
MENENGPEFIVRDTLLKAPLLFSHSQTDFFG